MTTQTTDHDQVDAHAERPAEERAEDFLDNLGRSLRRSVERVREEAEDVVAEARDVRGEERQAGDQRHAGHGGGRGGVPSARAAWYAGLGGMAALGLVEWPIAGLIAASHYIQSHSNDQLADELASGVDAGA